MLALHAAWSPGRGICLWAEDPARGVRGTSRARGARPHPFAADHGQLHGVAAALGATGAEGQAVLHLPSTGGPDAADRAPRPSAALVDDADFLPLDASNDASLATGPASSPAALAPWTVPVLELDARALLRAEPLPGEGAELEVLRALGRFAADLVTRGRVLPAPDPDHPDDPLGWRPVLQGRDLVAADAFAAALPPAVRAEALDGRPLRDGAGPDPVEVVTEALTAFVDAEARHRAAGIDVPADLRDAAAGGALDAGLARWEVVGAPHAGPARGTFRLTEIVVDHLGHAVEGEARFWLEFSLQSTQDPSLRVTAESIWRDAGALRRWLEDPSELLLAELGRAASLYPELTDALRVPRPTGMELDREGTHRFLLDVAADLDRAGFGVLLPSWWSRPARLGLTANAEGTATPDGVVATPGRLRREELVGFSWRLAVDGEPLSDEEMRALVHAKAPLVHLRGQWVAVDRERLRAGLEFLDRAPAEATVGDVLALHSTYHDDLPPEWAAPLPVEDVTAGGALGELLSGAAESHLALLDDPPSLEATLRPYQRRGVSWLAFLAGLRVGGVLADDMGLGKTLQVLALEAHERGPDGAAAHPPPDRPTLLVAPTSVVGTWQREAARFAPGLRVTVHHGAGRAKGDLTELLADADLVVTSYGTLTRDIAALSGSRYHRLVLDEAQLVKNNRSRAARAVRAIDAEHRLALTGTPVENRLAELWSIMDAVNPGLLGTVTAFRDRYAVPIERHGRTDVALRLQTAVRPFLLRRVKTDPAVVDDLPDKIETIERCPLTAEQASLYQVVVDEMTETLHGMETAGKDIERRGKVLAALTKLKQVCDHPALLLHDGSPLARRSGKLARVEEIVAEILAAGEKALLFTQFTEFGDMLAPHLAARFGVEVLWLHGGTSRRARDRMVEAFQDPSGGPDGGGGPPLFLLSLKAGGTGLTLTAAQHVVHLDRWWNPAVEDQATDRAFRIGQKRTVNVRKLMCGGTVEERIDDLIAGKRVLAGQVIGSGGDDPDWLTGLSTDELRRMVALDDPAGESEDEADDEADEAGADLDGEEDPGAA
ncbi:DEAD/DEAH box helicase [Actinomycetospora sp. TBRC 11914]|uniref:DEAD/DEAH box helicase n=1 Tax=Actinomycetospora sp. TBRC 11914 TaxID=2729387 RepID=UPI00145E771E|nr:DEAD/DEAH box helicase [Actinomycetospora sp. TBRC 11914]NMO89669.1 DEAD/DEAH box helicase [Actinomycetospora sp. TBRC 11914]